MLTPMKFIVLLLLCFSLPLAAEVLDGPYVMRDSTGKVAAWTVESTPEGVRKRSTLLKPGVGFTVPAVGALPSFHVTPRLSEETAPDVVSAKSKTPLLVVADTHGEYEIFAGMLQKHGVIDGNLRWSFGRGRLVILGDAVDRGAHQVEILWLVYALEAQARKAGGAVHFLLGNHETMLMRGDLRYLNPKYRQTTEVLGVGSYTELLGANSLLGQWLRSRAIVLKINDFVCLHGGISPALVERGYTLAQINATMRAALDATSFPGTEEAERAEFLFGETGPLWYRGYFARESRPAEATADDIGRIRSHFGAARILVGHTTVPTITPLYGGQVIAVQVYPRLSSPGHTEFEALLIRGGTLFRAKPDGSAEPLLP